MDSRFLNPVVESYDFSMFTFICSRISPKLHISRIWTSVVCRNPKEVTSTLAASQIDVEYLMKEDWNDGGTSVVASSMRQKGERSPSTSSHRPSPIDNAHCATARCVRWLSIHLLVTLKLQTPWQYALEKLYFFGIIKNEPKLDGDASFNYGVPMATFQLHHQTLITIEYQSTRQDESNEPKLDGVASSNYGVPMATFQLRHQTLITI
ncbi:hypothetical protein EVAR_54376_1 [Eumeta japonica]|uniref:Uncharacterized protein n=1 Tax=Eumeta variegata TaxID=151549 RepID=A0A4C1Y7N9_EUMVA|nr:hypothetical protein EVAR_54376_1 [Eumeta japonica]